MAQGKFKTKTKVPNQKQKPKGNAFTKRSSKLNPSAVIENFLLTSMLVLFFVSDAPMKAKKQKFTEHQKLKQIVSKNVNRSAEQEIRGRAIEGHINLSKAQQAVAKMHKEKAAGSTTETATASTSN